MTLPLEGVDQPGREHSWSEPTQRVGQPPCGIPYLPSALVSFTTQLDAARTMLESVHLAGGVPRVPVTGPLAPRRRLAAELRRLRERSNMRLEEVAKELMISTSKLSRLENAQGSAHPRDVRDLIRLYGVEGTPLSSDLMKWTDLARHQAAWWTDYTDVISAESGFDG